MTRRDAHYYWADGEKVPLQESSEVVIDLDSAAGARLTDSERDKLLESGNLVSGSLLMAAKTDVSAALGGDDSAVPGIHPVYRYQDGSLVVVLPEVRVESDRPETLKAVENSLQSAHVKTHTPQRLVLEPDSGRGADALTLANTVAESSDTDVAQARFLRIVKRPGPR